MPLVSLSPSQYCKSLLCFIHNLLSPSFNTSHHKWSLLNFLLGPRDGTQIIRLGTLTFKCWATSSVFSLSFLLYLLCPSSHFLFSTWFFGYRTDITIFRSRQQLHSEMQWGNRFSHYSLVTQINFLLKLQRQWHNRKYQFDNLQGANHKTHKFGRQK